MKRLCSLLVGLVMLAGCSKSDINNEELISEPMAVSGRCAAQEVLEQQLQEDPDLAARMSAIEERVRYIQEHQAENILVNGEIVIPVVFNILYKTSAQNLSLSQLQSQIDVLNRDFAATNSDYNNTPSYFQGVRSGDTKIRFVLDAVYRKSTKKTSWRTDDSMKKTAKGGLNPTSPTTKLNIWVCNLSGGILGYAQFPGGNSSTDGVVLDDNATGNTGTAAAPYGLGRTATHEVGHWLNLRHIWGDATCGNDFVSDTPLHQSSNGGCPAFPKYGSCSSTVPMMTMNYMDYTYDACMYMFTAGQNSRMQASFASGGGRNSFAQP